MDSRTDSTIREVEESALLAGLRAGDDDAFARFVRAYIGPMRAVARRILSNDEDADDAVQEAFLSAFKAIGNFAGQSRLSTWLHRIVVNAALMKHRSLRRAPERSIDDLLPQFLADGHHSRPDVSWLRSPEEVVASGELRAVVRQSIDRLPETYRTVLILRDIEELPTEETARLLGININAVKTRLHRARLALRALLDPYMRETTR
jgi:RNA polymerase sigma-70 factor, ECF subfamily